MRKLKLISLMFLALTVNATTTAAQACLGLPSFATGSVHVNVGAEFPDSATVYLVGIGAGKHNGLFANLGGFQVKFEGDDNKANYGFLEFGYQFPVSKAQVCPIASGSFGAGPDDDLAGTKITTRGAGAGLALGLPLAVSVFSVIPNVAVTYQYVSTEFEQTDAESFTDNFNSGTVSLGLGFIIRDRFSIQPLLHIPFGSEDDKSSFGIFASVSIGGRAR